MSFDNRWFNATPTQRIRGAAEGQSLADILRGTDKTLPSNLAWSGQPVCTLRSRVAG